MGKTCALTSDGRVVCWGPNYAPPPGETLPARFYTVDVSRLADGVNSIAVGETHSCALTNLGTVACWGPSDAPADVAGLSNDVTAIAVGGSHGCAVTTGGEVMCWGGNGYGQLGSMIRCSSTSVAVAVQLDGDGPTPPEPTWAPIGPIEHASGPTDVVLRLDQGPDLGVGELEGEFFQPGPEFTLYGDGTVIFRHDLERPPLPEGAIVRAGPFMTAHLDEDQVQALLLFALGEGGLADACDSYPTQDIDGYGSVTLRVAASGIERSVDVAGLSPLGQLLARLGSFDPGVSVETQVWAPDRYWGNLFEAASAIEIGLLPDPGDAGSWPWPWPDVPVSEFVGRDEGGWIGNPRRVMSRDEAAVLGLDRNGGVVQRVYLIGADGTIYAFSMWPMQPDEAAR